MYNKRLECRLPGGPLLALATLVLLLVAVAPVSAAEIQTDVSLPYSDEHYEQTYQSYEGNYPVAGKWTPETTVAKIYIWSIENFKHINYIQVDNTVGTCPLPEGRTEFYYKRPSDNKVCEGFAIVSVNRNLLGQITYSRTTYFFVDWEIGNKIGVWSGSLYSNPEGTTPLQSGRIYRQDGFSVSKLSDEEGNSDIKGLIYWYDDGCKEFGNSNIYIETYSNDQFKVSFEKSGLSVLTKIQREFNSFCISTIYMNDSAGNPVFSDRDLVDKEFYYPASKCAKCTVRMGDNSYIYNLPGSGPSPENDDFSLSLDRSEAANYDTVTATLSPAADAPEYDEIAWIHRDEQRTFSRLADGTWKEFNYDSLEYDIPSDEHAAHNYQFTAYCPPGVVDPEDLVICCLYSEGKQIAELTGRVEIVAGSSKTQLAVVVVDHSGGQTPVLFGADVTVRDEITKQYQAETGSDETFHRFVVDKNRRYIVTASMEGYLAASRTITASKDVQSTEIYLSRNATVWVPENSTQVDFLVKDTKNRHVDGVLIGLTDAETKRTLTGVTNSFGTRTFVVERGHIYQYSVTKDGYVGVRGTVDPGIPGTRTVVLCSEDAWGDTPPGQPGDPGHGPDPDHHELARETLNEVSGLIPHLFSLVFLMLFLCIMRRGGR